MATTAAKAETEEKKIETPETVTVRIPRTLGAKDEPDKVVWVNDTRYVIARGKNVEVPFAVAENLRNSDDQKEWAFKQSSKAPKRG